MENSSLTSLQKFSIGLYMVLMIVSLQGIISFGNNYLIIWGLWFIFTILAFREKIKILFAYRRYLCLFLFILFYFFSLSFTNTIQTSINRCVLFLYTASPVLMYDIIKDYGPKLKKTFLIISFLVFVVNMFLSYSFMGLVGEDNLRGSNDYVDLRTDSRYYIILIVFNMCYMFSIIVPGLMEIYRKYKQKGQSKIWVKWLLLGLMILLSFYLVRAQYMTAIVLAIFGAIVAYFYKSRKSLITIAVVTTIITIGFVELYPRISQSMDETKYGAVLLRLDEIHSTLTGRGHEASDMIARQDRSAMSMETFLQNPIFGVNHKIIGNRFSNLQGVGNHAEWPDSLALYGIFAFLFFIFLWDSLKCQRSSIGVYLPTFCFVLLGFLNPLWYFPQVFATFMFLPLMSDVVLEKD